MCSITGSFNNDKSMEHVLHALEITKNRGLNGIGVCTEKKLYRSENPGSLGQGPEAAARNVLGHRLHSMVNFVLQPIVHKGRITANCEIYNWKELAEKHRIVAKNDTDLLIHLIEEKITPSGSNRMQVIDQVLQDIIGVYAFAYWIDETVFIVRDILGIKPLWYTDSDGFAFSSEKKALAKNALTDIKELNPREILAYNIKEDRLEKYNREFFSIRPEHEGSIHDVKTRMRELLEEAVSTRMPDEKFGILFSGGLDSTIIACLCRMTGKRPGIDFTCYTAGLEDVQLPPDVEYSRRVADELGLDLKVKSIGIDEVEGYLKIVVPLVEDSNVPKVGVALTMYAACMAAREDGIRVMFSGSGADEIFAGYNRHKSSTDISRDCYADVLKIYEKNTYRDDVVSMNNNIELRVPYLDRRFVDYCLKIPPAYKINGEQNKIILRLLADEIGIPEEVSQRKKQAAQYGSRLDKAIGKLAKKAGCKTKTDYLKQFYGQPNLKLGVLFSSGKDSNYAMHVMQQQNYSIECLITIKSRNPDSYMFHTPNIDLARLQAEAMELPLIEELTMGEKEKELEDMKNAIVRARDEFGIDGVITGALYSNYQRERIERICDGLGLKVFSPLWHIDQEKEMRQLLDLGFEFIFSSIAAYGLNKSWVGRVIEKKDIDKLVKLNEKIGLNVAGEGGEFESFVMDGPMYKKKIEIRDLEVFELDEYTAKVAIKDAVLVDKG